MQENCKLKQAVYIRHSEAHRQEQHCDSKGKEYSLLLPHTHTHTLVVKCACVVPMTLFTPHQEAKLQQSHGNGNGGAPHCTVRTSGKKLMVHLRPLFFYNHLSFNILWQTAPCPGSCSFKGGLETFSTPAASSPSVPPYKPSPAPVSMVSRVLKCKSM